MPGWPEVWQERPDSSSLPVASQFEIGVDREGYEPPGVVVVSAIVVTFVEPMQSQAESQPQDPPFKIRRIILENQIVRDAKAVAAELRNPMEMRHVEESLVGVDISIGEPAGMQRHFGIIRETPGV